MENRVIVAGTFGPIHDGHRCLFREALKFGSGCVVIGLTSDSFAEKTRSKPRSIPSFEDRKKEVEKELEEIDNWGRSFEFAQIEDEIGVTGSDGSLDYIVVSVETKDEIEDINTVRKNNGLDPIKAIVVPYVLAKDGERISSTRIFDGEIDQHGNLK